MTSWESDTCSTSGNSSRTISAARSSCAGFTNEKRNITAIDCTSSCRSRRTPARTASSSSGFRTSPVCDIRSPIAMRARRRAIAGGAGYDGSQIISLWTRRISISSRWPWVTSSPVRAPFISIIVLSAVVVPWTTMSRPVQSCVTVTPKCSASWPMPVITPRDWSSSVVGVLSSTTSPSSVTQIRSVNVPPTSTPTRYRLTPLPLSGLRAGPPNKQPAHRWASAALAESGSTPPSRSALRAQRVGGGRIDRQGQVRERTREHHAVVTRRTLDAHVLVEHVVEHGLRVAVEGIAPAAASAVVVHDPLAGRDRHPVGGVLDHELVVGAVPDDHAVRLARLTAADARHRVLHADDVRVDLGVDAYFLLVVRAAEAAPLSGAAGVGAVVAAPLHVRVKALVDLGGRLPQVAEA